MATPLPPWHEGVGVPEGPGGGGEPAPAAGNGYRTRRERRAAEAAVDGGRANGHAAPASRSDPLPPFPDPALSLRDPLPRRDALPPRPAAPRLAGPVHPRPSGQGSWRTDPALDATDVMAPLGRGSAGPPPLRDPAGPPPLHDPAGPPHLHDPAGPPHLHDPATPAVSAVGAPPAPRAAALATGAHPSRPSVGRRLLRDAREVLGTVAIALGIAIVIKTFLIQPFYIPSQSMEDTLLVGDRVLVSKLEPGPFELDRGDIAVFVDPGGWLTTETPEPSLVNRALTFVGLLPANSGEHLIKRVIGLPGDTVRCCDAEGRLLVNNQPLDESQYLFPGDSPSSLDFEVVVPDGTVWVMGDHRSVSEDSRYHDVDGDFTAGAVPIDNVVGRAVLVMWPMSRLDWLGTPDGVFDGVGGQLDGVR
ncbi:MAG: signal peptidase I [Kineosporiaceae bacterium]